MDDIGALCMWSHTTFIKLHEECFKQLRLREINWPKLPLGGTDKAGIQTRSLTSKTMLIFCMVLCNVVKNSPASAGDLGGVGSIPESRRSPGGGNGNHSSILTCKIPTTGEPCGLQSMGSQRVRHS